MDISAENYITLSDGSVSPMTHLLSTPEDEDGEEYVKGFRGPKQSMETVRAMTEA